MIVHSYWRSGASHRLRIALNLKGLDYKILPVHLVKDGGEQFTPAYKAINPQGRVPAVQLEDGEVLIQSPAIIEWLEDTHPLPALLPKTPLERVRVRAVAAIVGCDIQPLGNIGPLKYLRKTFSADDAACTAWAGHWISQGFAGIEPLIEGGNFCFGKAPSLADVYLVPQVFAARRFKVDLAAFPKIARVAGHCSTIEAFAKAAPERQLDAE